MSENGHNYSVFQEGTTLNEMNRAQEINDSNVDFLRFF